MNSFKDLELINFSKSYGEKVVFDKVNYSFQQGKVYALLSPNGFGKTTLMKAISGTGISYDGSIIYDSTLIKGGNFNGTIVFSSSVPLFETLSTKVRDHIRQVCLLREVEFSTTISSFQKLQISKLIDSKCSSLSTGEKKILQTFLDLISDPDFIMFDEPLNGLDHKNRRDFIAKLHSLAEKGKTVIISTHMLRDLEGLADEALIIKDKKLISCSAKNISSTYEKIFLNNEERETK